MTLSDLVSKASLVLVMWSVLSLAFMASEARGRHLWNLSSRGLKDMVVFLAAAILFEYVPTLPHSVIIAGGVLGLMFTRIFM